jgi:hypothetical protein
VLIGKKGENEWSSGQYARNHRLSLKSQTETAAPKYSGLKFARESSGDFGAPRPPSLVPSRIFGSLLGGQNFDETLCKVVEFVANRDVTVQRLAVKLGEHVDLAKTAIETIADRDSTRRCLPPKRHRGFGTLLRQRVKTGTRAAAHDDGEGFIGRDFRSMCRI